MPLIAGTRLGSYEILAPLGAGGMGEVYRARDTRLGRAVAIKVLPAAFAHDPERLARFEREARVLASLHHPSIADIFGLESFDGHPALVMELVEGRTLAERIAAGPIPIQEVIPIARQIADALEAAHEKGIVHRDLKPDNVKVSAEGMAKVLDFGLASILKSSAAASEDLSQSPTITGSMTSAGVVLGTAGYMAPEQALGLAADRRADIWAFGVLLWELLTGSRLFSGHTVSETLAAVLHADLDWTTLPPQTPVSLRRLLRRCLQRDRKLRLSDIADARLELDEALEELRNDATGATTSGDASAKGRWSVRAMTAMSATLLVIGMVTGALLMRTLSKPRTLTGPALRSILSLPDSVRLDGWGSPIIAFSPDGTKLAFVGSRPGDIPRLYVQNLSRAETQLVPGSETAEGPFFSPDGQSVAFAVGTSLGGIASPQLKKFSFSSGLTQTLCDVTDYFGGAWGNDGTIYFINDQPGGVFKVPAGGGKAEQEVATFKLAGNDSARRALAWPQLLPDGHHLLLIDWSADRDDRAAVLDLRTRELKALGIEADFVRYAPGGHLIYARPDQTLMAVGFDAERRMTRGEPVAWMSGLTTSGNDAAVFDFSLTGTLAYTTGYLRGSLRELFRPVRLGPDGALRPLPVEPAEFKRTLRVSPDGSRAAACMWDGSVLVCDLRRGTRRRIHQGTETEDPVWSHDGRTLAFTDVKGGTYGLHLVAADGATPARLIHQGTTELHAEEFTRDGSQLFFSARNDPPGIYAMNLDGSEKPQLIVTSGRWLALSPDGRWIAYVDVEGARLVPFVRRLDGSGPGVAVTNLSSREPRWSRDGRELYYREGDNLMAVSVRGTGDPEVGKPELVLSIPDMRSYDTAPGHREFIVQQRLPESGVQNRLHLVTNWLGELERASSNDRARR